MRTKLIMLLIILGLLTYLFVCQSTTALSRTVESLQSDVSSISKNGYYNRHLCTINHTHGGFRGYIPCMNKNAKFVRVIHEIEDNIVSVIYRCEDGDMIGELKMSQYLDVGPISCDCKYFKKELNIPIGEATSYGDLIP